MTGPRPRVLFVGSAKYDLPLPASIAKKWDPVSERLDVRIIGRAGAVEGDDPRFRLVTGPARFAGATHLSLPPVVTAEINRFRPDVVVAQSPYEALMVLAARRASRHRPKLIVEVHGDWRSAARLYGSPARKMAAGLADRAAVYALRRADATRALSGFTARLAEDATGRAPIAAFPTYMDLGSFLDELRPLPDTPTVAWVGALQRVKNPEVFVDAWRQVAARVPDARLVMVGDGPLRELVDGLETEFPGRVTAHRRLPPPDVARVMDESTVLVLPSSSEGLGRVVIESFSRGRPVVGSDVGGIPDLIDPGRNGLLVPPGDRDALADALTRILTDRELAERLAAGAREDAPRLRESAQRYADDVDQMVRRALNGSAGGFSGR